MSINARTPVIQRDVVAKERPCYREFLVIHIRYFSGESYRCRFGSKQVQAKK
jgi:hypothetical protein